MAKHDVPENIDAFYARLRLQTDSLPKRLRQCAAYVVAHPDQVAVSTVAEISGAAGVQPSAFMRFCQELGFSGYSPLQKLFRKEYTQRWPDYKTRLAALQSHADTGPSALLAEFIEAGRASIESLAHTVNPQELQRSVDMLRTADTIHLVGLKRAFPIATYLSYVFEKMGVPAVLHTGFGALNAKHLMRENDAMIAISFAPYTQDTLELAEHARAKGLDIVAITDVMTSPLAHLDASVLSVSEIDVGEFRALSATLSLALTLAVAVGQAAIERI